MPSSGTTTCQCHRPDIGLMLIETSGMRLTWVGMRLTWVSVCRNEMPYGSVGVARQSDHAVFIHTQVAEAKVDTLVMKHFLSGFSDADAKLILKHCKEVLPKHANILLLQVRHINLTPVK